MRLKFLHTLRQLLVGVLVGLLVSLMWWLVFWGFMTDLGFLRGVGFFDAGVGFLTGAASLVLFLLLSLLAQKKTGPRLILPPPGAGLRKVLHVIYSPKIAERVFDQIIADMRLEWEEAIAHNQPWLARWIQVRGVLTILITAAVHAVATLHSIFKLVK